MTETSMRMSRIFGATIVAISGLCSQLAGPVLADDSSPKPREESAVPARSETNSVGMKLVLIRSGEFRMGSPETEPGRSAAEQPHRVQITRPFLFGETKVTLGEFRKFIEETGYKTEPETDGKGGMGYNAAEHKVEQSSKYNWRTTGFEQTDDHPVVNVTWNDSQKFCEWLSAKESRTYRLPTEAEWEYACRGGKDTVFQEGDDPEGLALVGNIADATAREEFRDWTMALKSRDGYVFTSPVRTFRPNAYGLYDMHGNACEWCADWYGDDFYSTSPMKDPAGPAKGTHRVNRGGCWGSPAGTCRAASRHSYLPTTRHYGIGFRVVAEVDAPR